MPITCQSCCESVVSFVNKPYFFPFLVSPLKVIPNEKWFFSLTNVDTFQSLPY